MVSLMACAARDFSREAFSRSRRRLFGLDHGGASGGELRREVVELWWSACWSVHCNGGEGGGGEGGGGYLPDRLPRAA